MKRGYGSGMWGWRRLTRISPTADALAVALARRRFCHEKREGHGPMPSFFQTSGRSARRIALLFVFGASRRRAASFKPTADPSGRQLLNALKEGGKITGRISIPDVLWLPA